MDIETIWNEESEYLRQFENINVPLGGLSHNDFIDLYYLIAKNSYNTNHNISNPVIVDLGSWTGTSSVLLAKIAKEFNGIVHCIDWFNGSAGTNLEFAGKYCNIRRIFENNLGHFDLKQYIKIIEKSTEESSKDFSDKSIDIIFIDANHKYDYIKKDLDLWYPKLKLNGLICGHDCEFLVNTNMEEVFKHYSNVDMIEALHLGVIRAVSEKFTEAKKTTTSNRIWYYVNRGE